MPNAAKRSFAALFAVILLVFVSLTAFAGPRSEAPAVTDSTMPQISTTLLPDVTTSPATSTVPSSSSMMDTPLTTTPDTSKAPTTTDSAEKDGGFAYTGLIIALVVAGLVIALIILLVPKNKDKT